MIATTRKSTDRNEQIQTLLERAYWLDSADQALLGAVYERGIPTRALAEAAGVSPRTIQRRVGRLVERLKDPTVLIVLRDHTRWPGMTGEVALAVMVRGRTLRAAADELGLSLHEVRQLMQQAHALIAVAAGRATR